MYGRVEKISTRICYKVYQPILEHVIYALGIRKNIPINVYIEIYKWLTTHQIPSFVTDREIILPSLFYKPDIIFHVVNCFDTTVIIQ